MRKNKIIRGLAVIALIGVTAITGIFAYLTDSDSVTNNFTVGKVDIELQEPNWDENSAKNIVPLQTIKKDPQVLNSGENKAYVYLLVDIPMKNVITATEDGIRNKEKLQELFTFSPNEGWSELEKIKTINKDNQEVMRYVYEYNHTLNPGDTTVPLFDSVQLVNVVEGQIDQNLLDIDISAYAIQVTGVDKSKAFNTFVKQNELNFYGFLNGTSVSGWENFNTTKELFYGTSFEKGFSIDIDFISSNDSSDGNSSEYTYIWLHGFDNTKPIKMEVNMNDAERFSISDPDDDNRDIYDSFLDGNTFNTTLKAGTTQLELRTGDWLENPDHTYHNVKGTIRFYQE